MSNPPDKLRLRPLIQLVHHRWNVPVIAELHRRSGAKFVTLANSLGASRNSLTVSLNDLIDQGYVQRNPGHGHPMRPEYLLTNKGEAVGKYCLRLARLIDRRDDADLGYRKWTLPLVAAIGHGVRRFGELRDTLGDAATPRATTLGLKAMLAADWAERTLIDDYPPTAGYRLVAKGRRILRPVNNLLQTGV
ncbi:MAG: winged helix-turn-helix transcriptional regulator [Woeseiaceae bacterium]|nr:winged helix-turn-helix transcriptional regulator [Woeseiaceae bacterium]